MDRFLNYKSSSSNQEDNGNTVFQKNIFIDAWWYTSSETHPASETQTWSVTTKYKHLQNLFVCIHLCLLCFCVWDAESPGLFDVVLHRKNQRSAHPVLTIFQSQPASEASLPGLTPGFQESLHVQRHFQSTSWSFELSVLAARKLWEMRIVSWLFGGYDNANLL